jgi:hypothetical protein
MKNPRYVMLAGAAAIILGSILPWVTASTIFGDLRINGTDVYQGLQLLRFGVIAGVLALIATPVSGRRNIWVASIGVVIGFAAFVYIRVVAQLGKRRQWAIMGP